VEVQAELVPRGHERQNDPARCTARHVQRTGATVVEVKGSHAVYVSQPREVAHLIEQASKSLPLAAR